MNKDEIIRLAGEAGLAVHESAAEGMPITEQLQRFAELVGAQEREACARACDLIEESHNRTAAGYWDFYLPTDCEDAASRGAGECARAIRGLRSRASGGRSVAGAATQLACDA